MGEPWISRNLFNITIMTFAGAYWLSAPLRTDEAARYRQWLRDQPTLQLEQDARGYFARRVGFQFPKEGQYAGQKIEIGKDLANPNAAKMVVTDLYPLGSADKIEFHGPEAERQELKRRFTLGSIDAVLSKMPLPRQNADFQKGNLVY